MAYSDFKISNFQNPVSSLPDDPSAEGMTAAELKSAFDSNSVELKNALNSALDALDAENLGGKVAGEGITKIRLNAAGYLEATADGTLWKDASGSGKSAYAAAVMGGYTGTEDQFYSALSEVGSGMSYITDDETGVKYKLGISQGSLYYDTINLE